MNPTNNINEIKDYFQQKLDEHGATAKGGDWNSIESQYLRFEQLAKVIGTDTHFTILDFGCGYGAFADYLQEFGYRPSKFYGFDLLQSMIDKAIELHPDPKKYCFTTAQEDIPKVDYTVASGVFNIRLQMTYKNWTEHVLQNLAEINEKSITGFAVNFLTKYSDPERMASSLYYADPTFLFDYCKHHFSKNVALLHDYTLYDFTIIVRK